MMYAEVQLVQAKEKYEHWLDNEGVTLASKTTEKKRLQKELSAKVCLYIDAVRYLNFKNMLHSFKLFCLYLYFSFSKVNRRTYVVSDPILRENISQQIELVANDVNALYEEQKLMKEQLSNLKKDLKEASDEADRLKKR
jgi:septal ring factor EnvC (AmiA/AmiB activator)